MMRMANSTRFAFFGTPLLAVEILDALAQTGFVPALVVTMPDKPQGRSMEITPPPVKKWALAHNVEILQPETLDDQFIAALKSRTINVGIVVAYGKILPQTLFDAVPNGLYNVHYSLLPRWRGATPVEAAILAGDKETGVSIQRMVYQLDAGPLVAVEKTGIDPNETAPALRTRLNTIAMQMLVSLMPRLLDGSVSVSGQDTTQKTTCGKISKEDGLISLSDEPALNYRKYLAYFGWPGIYTFFERSGTKIRVVITKARFENGALVIESVIPEGKREMSYQDFLRSGAIPAIS